MLVERGSNAEDTSRQCLFQSDVSPSLRGARCSPTDDGMALVLCVCGFPPRFSEIFSDAGGGSCTPASSCLSVYVLGTSEGASQLSTSIQESLKSAPMVGSRLSAQTTVMLVMLPLIARHAAAAAASARRGPPAFAFSVGPSLRTGASPLLRNHRGLPLASLNPPSVALRGGGPRPVTSAAAILKAARKSHAVTRMQGSATESESPAVDTKGWPAQKVRQTFFDFFTVSCPRLPRHLLRPTQRQ